MGTSDCGIFLSESSVSEGVLTRCRNGTLRGQGHMENTTRHTIDLQGNEYEQRTRLVLVGLPAFYVAVLAATIIDGILGRSLMAFWSLLLVMTCAFLLVRLSHFLLRLDTLAAWLWQVARCIALGAGVGLVIGLSMMLFGDGTSDTLSRGLGLASFSVLYGVLIALPAGCAVVLLDKES
jgi:hypothetical protein